MICDFADGTWYRVKLTLQCWTRIERYFSASYTIKIEKFSLQYGNGIGERKWDIGCCPWSTALIQAIGDGHGHVCLSSSKYPDFEVSIKCTAYRVNHEEDHVSPFINQHGTAYCILRSGRSATVHPRIIIIIGIGSCRLELFFFSFFFLLEQ